MVLVPTAPTKQSESLDFVRPFRKGFEDMIMMVGPIIMDCYGAVVGTMKIKSCCAGDTKSPRY